MKTILTILICLTATITFAQDNTKISTVDFVQIIDGQKEETIYYYENNWKVLREQAMEAEFILSYQLLETPYSEEAPFHIMLITTYADERQYAMREDNFEELIEARGDRRLLNEKQPGEFRKIIYNKEDVRHLFDGYK